MIRLISFIIVWLSLTVTLHAQISAPGLGRTNLASWTALGFRQALHPVKKIQSMTYIGFGRISNMDNYNPIQKPAIFVINQEFYHQFHKHWQYSGAISYRRQSEYENAPFISENPIIKQEFRLYGRFSYLWEKGKFKIVLTGRPEFRKFLTTDFRDWEESIQLRGRLRFQVSVLLSAHHSQRIVISSESLFSTSNILEPENHWTLFTYKESRFCLYYSIAPKKLPLVFNLGYMNNLVGTSKDLMDVSYFCFDIVWENPFGKPKQAKTKPIEYME